MIDVVERLSHLRRETESIRLYALVDGVQYRARRGEPMKNAPGRYPLFEGTADAPLAHAGPWLIDADIAGQDCTAELAALEREAPAVTWLMTPQDLIGLAQLLQLNLDIKLPDGRIAMIRFWDPRVLVSLVEVLTAEQRYAFFGHIHEWHLLHDERRVWIGRRRDNA
ncbi:MAG: DUF4123 domain-containing protein [Gammaproteobacteria bacterium]